MVEQVERFQPQLQLRACAQRQPLHQRQVDVLVAGPFHGVAARVAEGSVGREDKGAGVEPALGGRVGDARVAGDVGPVVVAEAEIGAAGVAVVDLLQQRDGEGTAALQRQHAAHLPVRQQHTHRAIGIT